MDTADLTDCDNEQIHLVGAIQGAGSMVRLRYFDLKVLGVSEDLLQGGKIPAYDSLFLNDPHLAAWLQNNNFQHRYSFKRILKRLPDKMFACFKHQDEKEIILEFEPQQDDAIGYTPDQSIRSTQDSKTIDALRKEIVVQMQKLTGFERIKFYQFDEEFNGQVVYEYLDANSNLPSYLGHHFPKSDIPKPSRRLLGLKPLRFIENVDSHKKRIVCHKGLEPIDLSFSDYRYTSVVHLEYLRNMNVKSTLTLSITYRNRLWGLIACHHSAPKVISPNSRNLCVDLHNAIQRKVQKLVRVSGDLLIADLAPLFQKMTLRTLSHDLEPLNRKDLSLVQSLLNADGIAYFINEKLTEKISFDLKDDHPLVEWILIQSQETIFYTNCLSDYFGDELLPDIAGIMIIPLSEYDRLVLVRTVHPEIIQWAGNPEKKVATKDGKGRISPRKSFETWATEQNDKSRSWALEELYIARRLLQAF